MLTDLAAQVRGPGAAGQERIGCGFADLVAQPVIAVAGASLEAFCRLLAIDNRSKLQIEADGITNHLRVGSNYFEFQNI